MLRVIPTQEALHATHLFGRQINTWLIVKLQLLAPERIALQALIDETQKTVNGKARIKLYKGHCRVVGRDSATDSLFNVDFATFEAAFPKVTV